MNQYLSCEQLQQQNVVFKGTAGVSKATSQWVCSSIFRYGVKDCSHFNILEWHACADTRFRWFT